MHWETRKFIWLLYCMVWNGAHNTSSQICLLEVGGRLNTGVGQAWALVVWKPLWENASAWALDYLALPTSSPFRTALLHSPRCGTGPVWGRPHCCSLPLSCPRETQVVGHGWSLSKSQHEILPQVLAMEQQSSNVWLHPVLAVSGGQGLFGGL